MNLAVNKYFMSEMKTSSSHFIFHKISPVNCALSYIHKRFKTFKGMNYNRAHILPV